jgi:hypothetical protein
MKIYTKSVYIPKKELERLNRLLDVVYDEEDMKREGVDFDSTLFLRTVKFDDGYEAHVRVCSGQHNLWSEAILFDPDGNEVSCIDDCSYEHIDGDWYFETEDANYTVTITSEYKEKSENAAD